MSDTAKSLRAKSLRAKSSEESRQGGRWENPMQTDGFEFVEFTSPQPEELGRLFGTLGFTDIARPRSKDVTRSEARRVGKECVSTCRSRWSADHSNTKTTHTRNKVKSHKYNRPTIHQ